jgi:hypothetical protein
MSLTEKQNAVLTGGLLGDLHIQKSSATIWTKFKHKQEDAGYVFVIV